MTVLFFRLVAYDYKMFTRFVLGPVTENIPVFYQILKTAGLPGNSFGYWILKVPNRVQWICGVLLDENEPQITATIRVLVPQRTTLVDCTYQLIA